jgi:hypothetical protein
MKNIILNNGEIAVVSDLDYDYLMQWKWNRDRVGGFGHVRKGRKIMAEEVLKRMRVIVGWNQMIAYEDSNRLNCTRGNLGVIVRDRD